MLPDQFQSQRSFSINEEVKLIISLTTDYCFGLTGANRHESKEPSWMVAIEKQLSLTTWVKI